MRDEQGDLFEGFTPPPDPTTAPFQPGDVVSWTPETIEADPALRAKGKWTVEVCGDDPLDADRWILHAEGTHGRITTRWPKTEDPRVFRPT